jgi:hypothetical protein
MEPVTADAEAPAPTWMFPGFPFPTTRRDAGPREEAPRADPPPRGNNEAGSPDAGDGAGERLRVGPAGGLLVEGVIALEVPAGALRREVELQITAVRSTAPGGTGESWLVEPLDTVFTRPVKVLMALTPELYERDPEATWVVSILGEDGWEPLADAGVDTSGVFSFGFTSRLGTFSLTRVGGPSSEAGAGDAGASDASSLDADVISADAAPDDANVAAEDADTDATLASEDASVVSEDASAVDAAAPVPFCVSGACANGQCVEGTSDYSCTCNAGFSVSADSKSCLDVDECTLALASCLAGAHCVNVPGSYGCECDAGLVPVGDGSCATPAPIDPCAGVICGANSTCTAGSCVCSAGYTLLEGACVVPDPCTGVTCGAEASCSAGTCVCTSAGATFDPTPLTCTPVPAG